MMHASDIGWNNLLLAFSIVAAYFWLCNHSRLLNYPMADTTTTATKHVIRLVVVSDTHGHHDLLSPLLPAGDIFLHCGDFANRGSTEDVIQFAGWVSGLSQYPEKIVIDGNHDRKLEMDRGLSQYPEKMDIDGDHDRKLETSDHVENQDSSSTINLSEMFGGTSVRLLQDETMTTKDGLVIHGSSWKSCEADSFDQVPQNTDLWMVHCNPFLDETLAHPPPFLSPKFARNFWKAWSGSRKITQTVRDQNIPLCLSGHVHFGRGTIQLQANPSIESIGISGSLPPRPSTFVNVASMWPSCLGIGVSPPVVIDFDLRSGQVLHVQVEPHPEA